MITYDCKLRGRRVELKTFLLTVYLGYLTHNLIELQIRYAEFLFLVVFARVLRVANAVASLLTHLENKTDTVLTFCLFVFTVAILCLPLNTLLCILR